MATTTVAGHIDNWRAAGRIFGVTARSKADLKSRIEAAAADPAVGMNPTQIAAMVAHLEASASSLGQAAVARMVASHGGPAAPATTGNPSSPTGPSSPRSSRNPNPTSTSKKKFPWKRLGVVSLVLLVPMLFCCILSLVAFMLFGPSLHVGQSMIGQKDEPKIEETQEIVEETGAVVEETEAVVEETEGLELNEEAVEASIPQTGSEPGMSNFTFDTPANGISVITGGPFEGYGASAPGGHDNSFVAVFVNNTDTVLQGTVQIWEGSNWYAEFRGDLTSENISALVADRVNAMKEPPNCDIDGCEVVDTFVFVWEGDSWQLQD